MTRHLEVDDDTDCEGEFGISKLSALRCQVRCEACGETLEYLRGPT